MFRFWIKMAPGVGRMLTILGLVGGLCCGIRPAGAQGVALAYDHEKFVPFGPKIPVWSGKYLLRSEDDRTRSPLIDAVGLTGEHERISFELPNAGFIQIDCMSGGADGSIVLGGVALSDDSRAEFFLAWISPDRKTRTVIRPGPFRANAVAVASDGAIWAAGLEFDIVKGQDIAQNVIQRYDISGKLLTSVRVPGAKAMLPETGEATMASTLMSSSDRVGWLTNGFQYIEFSLRGSEIARFDGPEGVLPVMRPAVALSQDNRLILGPVKGASSGGWDMLELDRGKRVWFRVAMAGQRQSDYNHTLGFDGTSLVTQLESGRLRWWKPAETATDK